MAPEIHGMRLGKPLDDEEINSLRNGSEDEDSIASPFKGLLTHPPAAALASFGLLIGGIMPFPPSC